MRYVILIVVIFFLAACENNKGQFLLLNESSRKISKANLFVGKQSFEFKNIVAGDKSLGSYEVLSDTHYKINITFESGKNIQKNVGYITHGFNYSHRITITDNDIELSDAEIN
jgi:hypothetical protein